MIRPFHEFLTPALRIAADGQVHRRSDLTRATLESVGLTQEEMEERLPSGSPRAANRAGWAVEYLCQAGALERPERGQLRITDLGRQLLADHPDSLKIADIADTPGFQDWSRRTKELAKARRRNEKSTGSTSPISAPGSESDSGASPIEQLVDALEMLDQRTAAELIDRLREQPPVFLERAVLRLLQAMGYGGSEADQQHLGRSNDGGLDGVIRQDALGIERVYVQAKRYRADNTVGPATVREFAGALADVGASGGVLITTSSFTAEARKFAERNPRLILIDGVDLGRLMVQYEVGVSVTQTLRVTEVDENFFDGDGWVHNGGMS